MLIRVVRAVSGGLLLLAGIPLLLAGGGLWFAAQHQDPTGGYAATVSTMTSDGYAVVSSDLDGLLRREAPFARSDRTTLELTAETPDGPAFLGLAPAEAVATYLAGVPYSQVDEVRLARGPLPVVTSEVSGENELEAPPQQQTFWLSSSRSGVLSWSAEDLRGEQVALVVMSPDLESPLTVDLRARVYPHWLGSTTVGLLLLGTVLALVAVALLVWPRRSRQVVYVVPPAEVPQVAAQLGVPVPRSVPDRGGAPGLHLVPSLRGVPDLWGAPDGPGGGSGDPVPARPDEEGPSEPDDYQLDTVPMTDRAAVADGGGVEPGAAPEPRAEGSGVDAADPESDSGPSGGDTDRPDAPDRDEEDPDLPTGEDAPSIWRGALTGPARWEWPPIVQQLTPVSEPAVQGRPGQQAPVPVRG